MSEELEAMTTVVAIIHFGATESREAFNQFIDQSGFNKYELAWAMSMIGSLMLDELAILRNTTVSTITDRYLDKLLQMNEE